MRRRNANQEVLMLPHPLDPTAPTMEWSMAYPVDVDIIRWSDICEKMVGYCAMLHDAFP